VQVGLVHNWFWFEPKASSCVPFYTSWLCSKLTALWGNEATMQYLQTGVFDWKPFRQGSACMQHLHSGQRPFATPSFKNLAPEGR
jgi:hypothetical protein